MPLPALARKAALVDLGAKLVDFGAATRVALLDAGAQTSPACVEQHDRGQHAGHADGGDVSRRDAARGAAVSRVISQTFAHHCAGSSSAQPA